MARSGRLALAMLMVAIVLCTLACGDSSPSGAVTVQKPRPTLTPRIGMTWAKAPYVGRAEDLFPVDSNPSTGPDRPGTPGHPGHFPGQEIMADVASVGGRFVAVGYGGLRGEWTARVWTSADALTWTESTLDHTIGSFAVAIATTSDGHVIAVGRAGRLAMAWLSTDGMTWAAKPLGSATPDPAQRASAITVTDLGIIVGGSYGPELGARTAVFWRSVDGGNSWQGGPSDAIDDEVDLPTFDGAEVSAIARTADGLVAMGRLGTGQRWTGSLAWLSTDGVAWRRVDDAALGGGLAVSLVVTPDWILAVGSDADEREAVVWASPDGASWVRAAPETSRLHFGEKVRMTDVVALAGGYVAVGNYVGVQFGQGTSWVSSDGSVWERAADQPVWGQGEPSALIAGGPGLVSVGTFGAPDNYVPTIWLSPALP